MKGINSISLIKIRQEFLRLGAWPIQESPPQFENRIMARVYIRNITRSTMFQKAPFCLPELAFGKLVLKHVGSALLKSIILNIRKV